MTERCSPRTAGQVVGLDQMSSRGHPSFSATAPRLHRDLADWYPRLTPVGDDAEEAADYRRLFETHCRRPPRTLLDLSSDGGHNVFHLKAALACTLVDLERKRL